MNASQSVLYSRIVEKAENLLGAIVSVAPFAWLISHFRHHVLSSSNEVDTWVARLWYSASLQWSHSSNFFSMWLYSQISVPMSRRWSIGVLDAGLSSHGMDLQPESRRKVDVLDIMDFPTWTGCKNCDSYAERHSQSWFDVPKRHPSCRLVCTSMVLSSETARRSRRRVISRHVLI